MFGRVSLYVLPNEFSLLKLDSSLYQHNITKCDDLLQKLEVTWSPLFHHVKIDLAALKKADPIVHM